MRESGWKRWLLRHREDVLKAVGIGGDCTILDFGCGSGAYALTAAALTQGTVYALDKNKRHLEELSERCEAEGLDNVRTIASSDLHTGLEDASMDVALLHDVLHLIKRREALIAELHRVLRPGGLLSVHPMHLREDKLVTQMCQSGFLLERRMYEGHILRFNKSLD